MLLIQTLIMTCGSLRENESWVPLCMPGISADGFLQLYSNFLPPNQYGILFITEKQEQTSFSYFTELARKIYDEIKEKEFMPSIARSILSKKNTDYIKEELKNSTQDINVESLKEFIKTSFSNKKDNYGPFSITKTIMEKAKYPKKLSILGKIHHHSASMRVKNPNSSRLVSLTKIATKQNTKNDPLIRMIYGIVRHKKNSQFFTVNMHSHDELNGEEKYVLKSYIKLYDYYVSFSKNLNSQDHFTHIEKDNKYSHGLYINENLMIFGTFNMFKPNDEIAEILKECSKLIKQYENNFFISLSKIK